MLANNPDDLYALRTLVRFHRHGLPPRERDLTLALALARRLWRLAPSAELDREIRTLENLVTGP